MKTSEVKYITHRYPLAMEKSMSRWDCVRWLKAHGYPEPPKSACIFCPFHTNAGWRSMLADSERKLAIVALDRAIRHQPGFKLPQFMHRTCVPIDQVDFSTDEDRGQLNMFNNECEGICGV